MSKEKETTAAENTKTESSKTKEEQQLQMDIQATKSKPAVASMRIQKNEMKAPDGESNVGAELKAAREAKKLTLSQVSSELNIKPAQLEALEKGTLDKLPGMVYAVGFARNYALYLGLDGESFVQRFRSEHIRTENGKDFAFPEPVYESSVSGSTLIGIGAFLSIVILLAWIIYSSIDVSKIAETNATAVENSAAAVVAEEDQTYEAPDEKDLSAAPTPAEPEEAEVAITEAGFEGTPAAPVESKPAEAAAPVAEVTKNVTVEASQAQQELKAITAPVSVAEVPANQPTADGNPVAIDAKTANIEIKKKVSTVMLKAKEASWIQVTDKDQKVIFRKVLRPGDEYAVPEQKGLSLVTANAGGLEVFVRGQQVQSIGESGEIVRGISLEPKDLEVQKIKSRSRR